MKAAVADWESRLPGGGSRAVPSPPSGHSTYSITPFDLFDCPIRPIRLPYSTYSITPFDLFDYSIRPIRLSLSTYSITPFDLFDYPIRPIRLC